MNTAPLDLILALGSNIGNRFQNLSDALSLLKKYFGNPIKISNIYESNPVDFLEQPKFLNMVALYRSSNFENPLEILSITKEIENILGRKKIIPKGPRNIDIDILYVNNLKFQNKELTLPHPGILERDFVIFPLQEVARCTKNCFIPKVPHNIFNNLNLYQPLLTNCIEN